MKIIPEIAQSISIVFFAWYGMSCFFLQRMVAEFERFRLARYRVLTGFLQVAASLGMIVGHFYRPILLISAGGLTVMMFLAVITRFRIRDPLYAAIPAFAFFLLNLYIFVAAVRS